MFGDRLIPTGMHLYNTPHERLAARQRMLGEEVIGVNGTVRSRDPVLVKSFRQRGTAVAVDLQAATNDRELLAYCKRFETAHALTFVSNRASDNRVTAVSFLRAAQASAYDEIGRAHV